MYKVIGILILFFSQTYTICLQDTKLKSVFMVNCNQDRMTSQYLAKMSNNPAPLEKMFTIFGQGQSSQADNERNYQLGNCIRQRYDSILSPTFVPNNLYVRTGFSNDTITSILMTLAGIYNQPESAWMDILNWLPLPYSTVPLEYDYNYPFLNCPQFITQAKTLPFPIPEIGGLLSTFSSVCDALASVFGFQISNDAEQLSQILMSVPLIYDFVNSQVLLGLPCSNILVQLLPDLKLLADHCLQISLGNPQLLPMQIGVLLNELFRMVELLQNGSNFPEVYIHAAHPFNLYSFLLATKVTLTSGPPPFGAFFALEFREEIATGKLYVLPVYVNQPGDPETYLTVDGCGDIFCEYDQFKSLTEQNSMPIDQWRSKCGWSANLNIDTCSI